MKFCYFPIQVLKSQETFETKAELKDGRIVFGILKEMDTFMNLRMVNAWIIKDKAVTMQEELIIRGSFLSGIQLVS